MSFASHAAKSTAIHRDHRRPPLALDIRNVRTHDALARFSGDEARYRYWLGDFIAHGPRTVRKIRAAVDTGEQETATRLVHSFKGRTGMLGMIELHALALALETTLRNGEPSGYWLDDLERTVTATCHDLTVALGCSGS